MVAESRAPVESPSGNPSNSRASIERVVNTFTMFG